METVYLDIAAGEGTHENLLALVAEGYEIRAAHEGLVVLRKQGRRYRSEKLTPPAPAAAGDSAVAGA